ncbi:permease prefix domain 1-containing protein [Paenisporosarcina sp. TG20]|uniref:permease prefix domain 1-containing protein n=1 Tax=Paenisporosarcina sp. TG20 TaxID=1211706 RepID=UPI0002E98037|nr:permease prefix domain 1-containing protein [Paenisporosarcina sp. TG20]
MISINKDTFLTEVIKQIKSKKAKSAVKAELEYHLDNSKTNWIEKGFSEQEAEEKTVGQMGNSIKLGIELNQLHSPWYIYLLKLNAVSFLYAIIIWFPIALMAHVYKVSRITGLNISTVNTSVNIIILVVLIVGTLFLFFITKRWLKRRKSNFWTIILWIPYWILLVTLSTIFSSPLINADDPGIGIGIIAFGAMIVFPVYILLINLVSYASNNKAQINK